MKRPAYAKQFRVTGLPLAFLFVGEPLCWEHAKQAENDGFLNHLVLPDVIGAGRYDWSLMNGMEVVVIHFSDETADQLKTLVGLLFKAGALCVAVRDFHDPKRHVVQFERGSP